MARFLCLTMLLALVGIAATRTASARGPRAIDIESAAADITAAARALQPGELVVLSVTTSGPVDHLRAKVFGREFPGFSDDRTRWRVLMGIDLDVVPGRHLVEVDDGAATVLGTYPLIVTRHSFATRNLKVDEGFVNPPANVQDRIAREAARLDQLWKSPTPTRLWSGEFVRPVPDAANSAFGSRSVFNGQPRSPHGGADFLSPSGRVIVAPNAGRVVVAGDLYYTGGTVVIDHGLGVLSLFAHLSAIEIHEGDMVATGGRVGLVGATGRVTGPHLHWAVRVGGTRVDPLSLLSVLGQTAPKRPAGTAGDRYN